MSGDLELRRIVLHLESLAHPVAAGATSTMEPAPFAKAIDELAEVVDSDPHQQIIEDT